MAKKNKNKKEKGDSLSLMFDELIVCTGFDDQGNVTSTETIPLKKEKKAKHGKDRGPAA